MSKTRQFLCFGRISKVDEIEEKMQEKDPLSMATRTV